MSDYQPTARRPIADVFRTLAHGAVRYCVANHIHPDTVSYSSMVAAAGAGLCFWLAGWWPPLVILGSALCYLRLYLNMLDGMVALASGKASLRGEILNDLPDRVSDALIFAGVAHSGLCHMALGYWAAILALLTAYVGTFGQAVGVGRQFSGVMSKQWRMVALSVGSAIVVLCYLLGRDAVFAGYSALDWTLLVIILGCVETIAVRLQRIMRGLERKTAADQPPKSQSEVG